MPQVLVTFLGSGDAFGSGGRLETCLLLESGGDRVLIDCGPTALAGLKKRGIDPSAVHTVLISHLHGDHFAGIPSLILDGQFSKRTTPLTIAGPPGLVERVRQAQEVLYPRSSETTQKYPITYIELPAEQPTQVGPASVTPYPVVHFCGAVPYALRVEFGGRTITYSGDTEWVEALLPAARGSDLFVTECYYFDRKVKFHMDYASLVANRAALQSKRIVLTHMSAEMLGRINDVQGFDVASDDLTLTL
ncbi:MAG: MBL fold metallo-hydrolase [Acidobacteria bacterium]|nr:MBL fold metallo-hydrolase [Acidobacteriota bacterium]